MEQFDSWFCLNNRLNFTVDPQVNPTDAQYYFGREDIKKLLHKQIRYAFIAPGIPKMMVWGPYGSGKTQTLYYLKHYLMTDPPASAKGTPHALYLTVEMKSNSTANQFHMQLMEALGKDTVAAWVRKLFDSRRDFDAVLLALADNDNNVYKVLRELRATGESAFTAWRWLTGQSLTPKDLSGLEVTRNLGDLGSVDLVRSVIAIGNLAAKVDEQLIFLIDELEQLQNVKTGDSAESIHKYLRSLADNANSSVGFLIGFKADVIDDAPEVLRRGDILGRVGQSNYIDIPHLPAVSDVNAFIKELLKNLTEEAKVKAKIAKSGFDTEHGIFPFDRNALELLADYATQDPSKALPRFIISAINECAIQAWDEEKPIIDEAIVNDVAPHVFQ